MDSDENWLDLKAERIYSLTINDVLVDKISWSNGKVLLPGVKEGDNVVEILYTCSYANDGLGLHSYTDPEDQLQYLYSQCEPFYCHRWLPCFDQPDLKCSMELHVMAPDDWRVIANEYASTIVKVSAEDADDALVYEGRDETKSYFLHQFTPTKKISTYLYCVCAGPYEEILRKSNSVNIPLGLYCRKSLFKYMQAEQEKYFTWTIRGFKFYQEFFQTPYPYNKYDQVFVPEFKFGAMENVGCVTYRDQYVFREMPSRSFESGVAHTFLHEMAHMWFGNLVTMQWWNDLWLNESFADWASYFCQAEATGDIFPAAWNSFLTRKAWGYSTDQASTTHPIECRVENTEVCETIFDGISYSKGAAVLKQLQFILGDTVFSNALKNYFTKHAESNTVFNDLVTELDEESKRQKVDFDIWAWADRWIKTAGLNELAPGVEVDTSGNITKFVITQTPALEAHPTLRDHKINMQFIDKAGNQSDLFVVQVQAQAVTEFPEFVGKPAPACVLLNVDDQDFCKVVPDATSVAWFKENLQSIKESLTRQLVWRSLWDMVRDFKLSAVEYIELILTHVSQETDGDLASSILVFLPASFGFVPNGDEKDSLRHQCFEMLLNKVKASKDQLEANFYTKKVLQYMVQREDVQIGLEWLKNNATGVQYFDLSQDDRWTILKHYAEQSLDAKALVDAEGEKDKSDSGTYGKIYCEYAYPENKAEKWETILEKGKKGEFSNYEQLEAFTGWKRPRQKDLLAPHADAFYEKFNWVLDNCDKEFAVKYVMYLIPTYAGDDYAIEKLTEAIANMPEQHKYAERKAKDELDAMKRARDAKKLSSEYLASKAAAPAKPEEEKKAEEKKPEAKPEEPKQPEVKPEEIKKPEAKPEQAKKPEAQPEEVKKPEAKPEEVKKPEAKPEAVKEPEVKKEEENKAAPAKQEEQQAAPAKTEEQKASPAKGRQNKTEEKKKAEARRKEEAKKAAA